MKTDVLVIGGGLAGLSLADQLQKAGRAFHLVEARDRFGGRILTESIDDGYFDLGPAWFWDGQPRIAALINRFGLKPFEQYYEGILTYENERGHVQRGRGYASMQGSYRLEGGLDALIQMLANGLLDTSKTLNSTITHLTRSDTQITAKLASGDQIVANQVVLALPPRIAAQNIVFSPELPKATSNAMTNVSTWMAGQAKAIAVYDTPFWRDEGLSGDAQSRRGPMVEIHDASPVKNGPYALFGFIGVPPEGRADEQRLRTHLLAQLERLFGSRAAQPNHLLVKDWALDPHTAVPLDCAPMYSHPQYGLPTAMNHIWGNALHFGGTEVAAQFGGYLEGALEAAETVFSALQASGADKKLTSNSQNA
ncbi:MAG: FAD-dependent oxidoreductase [Litoreibacter sp.]